MRSIIICEGSTDYALLQYYLRKAYGWNDSRENTLRDSTRFKMVRTLCKKHDTVSIGGAGGSNRIIPCLEQILEINRISAQPEESFDRVVIITDRDEWQTENEVKEQLMHSLQEKEITSEGPVEHNSWLTCSCENGRGREISFRILLLVIPFESTGALETFLLDAIAEKDEYDRRIIEKCRNFVDVIDPDRRYLHKRRYMTKAKFDVYFSVRTAAEQFVERQNILRNVEWEKYNKIQSSFGKLEELSE